MRRLALGVSLLTLGMLPGCAALRENHSLCKAVAIGTGALLGATAGGLISGVAVDHGDCCGEKNLEIGGATAGGALIGTFAGLGAALSMCNEPYQPPPMPAERTPPPPPPPPTPRRGG